MVTIISLYIGLPDFSYVPTWLWDFFITELRQTDWRPTHWRVLTVSYGSLQHAETTEALPY